MSKLDSILALSDEIKIIEAVGDLIWNKKQESNNLSQCERNFILIDVFEGAMQEGGFAYFFKTETGNFAKEVIAAYKEIEAQNTANIITKAVGLFGLNNFYDDLEKREKVIHKLHEEVFSGWEDLDEIFFNDQQEEDIVALIVAYIQKNKNTFLS